MNRFKGWKKVFSFTLCQLVKKKAYLTSTILVALLIGGGIALLCYLDSEPDEAIKTDKIIVSDNSGFKAADYSTIGKINDRFNKVKVIDEKAKLSENELIKKAYDEGTKTAAVKIDKKDKGYVIKVLIPQESELDEDEGDSIAELFKQSFESFKYGQAGFNEEQLLAVTTPVTTKVTTLGEGEESIALMFVRMFAPMLVGLTMYMMILLYGQTIAKGMMEEKTSKILELMLTSTKSYALITGKIGAMICGAIIQLTAWVGSGVIGYYYGMFLAKQSNPDYKSPIQGLISMLRDNNSASAFSPVAIVISALTVVLGFIMFSVLAGAVGSFINRAEDMSSVMMWFTYTSVVGFLIPYFGQIQENKGMIIFGRYFPICAPFSIPADVVVGNVSIVQALIADALVLVVCIAVIVFAGKVYNIMVLYTGEKVKLKNIGKMLKS